MSDNSTKWKPNDNHKNALSVIQRDNYDYKVIEMCGEVGIDPSCYYLWFKKPAFVEWWLAEEQRFWAIRLPHVRANLYRGATGEYTKGTPKPDGPLIKLYLERFDKDYTPRTKQEISGSIKHDIDIDAKRQIDLCTAAAKGFAKASTGEPGPTQVDDRSKES